MFSFSKQGGLKGDVYYKCSKVVRDWYNTSDLKEKIKNKYYVDSSTMEISCSQGTNAPANVNLVEERNDLVFVKDIIKELKKK